jgi:lipopolysaccharide biosynthesis protein
VPQNLIDLMHYFRAHHIQTILVSTNLDPEYLKTLSPYAKVITRPNLGYDFCSYKLGIENIQEIDTLDRLLLLNSSFVTLDPEKLLANFLAMPQGPALRGLTKSYDTAPHIQSFWLSFDSQALIGSEVFKEWWANVIPLATKDEIIRNYEIGMSQWFADHHVPLEAPIGSRTKIKRKPVIQNITKVTQEYVSEVTQVYEQLPSARSAQERIARLKKLLDPQKVWTHLKYVNPIRPRRFLHLIHERWTKAQLENPYFNPAHDAWQLVYERFAVLKVGLLDRNPTQQDLSPFYENASPRELELVADALSSSATN